MHVDKEGHGEEYRAGEEDGGAEERATSEFLTENYLLKIIYLELSRKNIKLGRNGNEWNYSRNNLK